MKKLLIAAAAIAVAGVSQGAITYQYKASVKHMYAKRINVRDAGGRQRNVYQKFVKSASLKGWLVVDDAGATSAELIADRGDANTVPPVIRLDHGRNRAFLVVQNPGATVPTGVNPRTFRTAKVLPAIIEANFIDTSLNRFDAVTGAPMAPSGLAEGYLYVGGEMVAPVRPKLDMLAAGITERTQGPNAVQATPQMVPPAAAVAGMGMIQDYVWTSCYLFGEYNGPDYEGRNRNPGWWQQIQTAIDAGFEPGVSLAALCTAKGNGNLWDTGSANPITGAYYFHDTWMNGSGFGKFTRDAQAGSCCGFSGASSASILENLSGNLKGGLLLCTYEGLIHGGNASWLNNFTVWEDQWFTPAWGGNLLAFTFAGAATHAAAGDQNQVDLWQDGPLELNTTDIITGTWSIKRRIRNVPTSSLTLPEVRTLSGNNGLAGISEASTGLQELLEIIKGCALDLNNQTIFVATTGNSEVVERVIVASTRYSVPAITPWFAQYYGLANWR